MQELQRQLLLAQGGNQIDLLQRCCQTEEGRQWCRQRFHLYQVLEWMWQEEKGGMELLGHWDIPSELQPLLAALVPEGYSASRLGSILFPLPGRYRLDESGVSGVRKWELPPELYPVLRRRVREIRPLPPGYRLRETQQAVELLPDDSGPRIRLSQMVLEESGAEVVAYGAKDTGEMGGGAAGALLLLAGEALEKAAREHLGENTREVGETFFTPSFGLARRGIQWVCHIVSIIKYTDRGAYCPHPERLESGVARALQLAEERQIVRMAFSALGTGEGRVQPEHCARMMIGAARSHFRVQPESLLRVNFCLPGDRDFAAFEKVLAQG